MLDKDKINQLNNIAKAMVAPSKGILAADESTGTIGKRFEKINLENIEANRRAYREMLFTAPEIGKYISGVIMFDETIRQSTLSLNPSPKGGGRGGGGRTFVSVLQNAGVLPGIKVDQGTMAGPSSPEEKITKGLAGLPKRLLEYASLGAKFAKWRAVITIDESKNLPTDKNLRQNARDLAAYALKCQQAGLVPMVEPEVLMDGSHTMEKCEEVSQKVLEYLFEELGQAGAAITGLILKTNMVIPGKASGQRVLPGQIAEATLRIFKKVLPKNLPGQAFLSGGQSEVEATENLNAINLEKNLPWQISFSYGRALQDSALKIWAGQEANVKAAQKKFIHRAKMNSLARDGKYDSALEAL